MLCFLKEEITLQLQKTRESRDRKGERIEMEGSFDSAALLTDVSNCTACTKSLTLVFGLNKKKEFYMDL
jgi:hypothetical protein